MSEPEISYYQELMNDGVPETLPKDYFAFEDLFDEFVASNQKTWSHDRNTTVGASEAFGCIRKSWFGKMGKDKGFKKDPSYQENWGAMRRGDLIENYHVVPAVRSGLERRGLALIMEGDDQETIIDGIHSATLDGLIIDPTGAPLPRDFLAAYGVEDIGEQDSIVLEMKSFDPRINIHEAKGIHIGQTQMQMGLVRDTSEYKPQLAVVLYVQASWLDDIRCFVVDFDPDTYMAGRTRNEKIFSTDDPAELPAEGKLDGMCVYCPFKNSCDEVSAARVPEREKTLTKGQIASQDQDLLLELDTHVHHQQSLKAQEKKLKKEIETANENVRQALIARNRSRAVGNGWKVSYTVQKGRKTLSKERMKDAGLDPEDYMEEGGSFEKLTITTEWDNE